MIYTNLELKVDEKEFTFGKLKGVTLGERGRGRFEVFLPVPPTFEKLEKGMNANLSIGLTQNKKFRINNGDNGKLYLILTSQAGYTRRGSGYIYEFKLNENDEPKVKVLATANGADGDAGRIGSWEAQVMEVKPGAIVKVVWSGSGYGICPTYYFVDEEGDVVGVDEDNIQDFYDYRNVEMPEAFKRKFNKEEN
jgi:hypothetical protein